MRIVGQWLIDFNKQVAYAKAKNGHYIRRNFDGSKELIKDLPVYVKEYLQANKNK